jgi:ankyrin repeat protein
MTFEEAHRCIKLGDLISLRRALENNLDPNLSNRFAWTLLMLVAMKGDKSIAELLFAKGAKINATNDFGETPLSLAAHAGLVQLASWLLSNGASTDCYPHRQKLGTYLKDNSGLSDEKLNQVLSCLSRNWNSRREGLA